MTITNNNGNANIEFVGRIDSSNAPVIEKEIWDSLDIKSCQSVTIDANKLKMISSAGLRILLKIRKQCPKLRFIGANPDVYEVLDMTGFSEMMEVEKAYRMLSVEGCEVLGEGSNGIVYRYDPETVVKVYRNPDALNEISRERELARKALILGIPTAIPFDVVKVCDKYGSVFELLNAKSFSKLIAQEPENTDHYIELFVDLLKTIHSTEADCTYFEDIKKVALSWAGYLKDYLTEEQNEKLISLIQSVPERNTMIHGDYHTNNVEMQDGEVLLIDMDTLAFGHPVFELGSMFLGFVGFGEYDPNLVERFLKLPYEKTVVIWRKTLELYIGTTDSERIKEIEDKAKIIGYTRLMRRTIKRIGFDDPAGKAIVEDCRAKLTELLNRVDSLDF